MISNYSTIGDRSIAQLENMVARMGCFLGEKLYGDRSHFIYELLQNAEDALSLRRQKEPQGNFSGDVKFQLFTDHLEFSHYGKLFDEADVWAICEVLRGTKSERLDQLGTHGIGFKSVYAFTASPEVHSGDEHFVIEQLIRPRAVEARKLDDPAQTLFYFPFDHPEFSAESAFNLIQAKLKSLGPRSLLFLNHVKELQWTIEDEGCGLYKRDPRISESGGSRVTIIGKEEGKEDTEEEWLVVQHDVQHPTRPEILPVKMAYSLKRTGEGHAVQPLSLSPLTAYFPTAKETGLAFLIHGPFTTTPARDNIESDCPWNDLLLKELATLVAESLAICQKHGFLTADFLAALPIDEEAFPVNSQFRAIYESVLQALKTQAVIPTADGGHARAADLVLGRSQDLRDLLPPKLLGELLGPKSTCVGWVDAGVTENRLPKVLKYLRDECEILVFDGETFSRHITAGFLDQRDEDWMIWFYSFLTGQEALWRPKGVYNYPPEGPLRKKPIIRCDDGQHRAPFDGVGKPAVFLPVEAEADYPVVNKSIYRNEKASDFVQRLGLVAPDICTRVLAEVLPHYAPGFTIKLDDHAKHRTLICDALALTASPRFAEMLKRLKEVTWILVINAANGTRSLRRPTDIFLRLPHLQIFFQGNETVWFLDESDENIDWQTLGVRAEPILNCRSLQSKRLSTTTLVSSHGRHQRSYDGFDPETMIDGLEHALRNITLGKAAYIWNDLLPPLVRFLHGRYEEASHQNFDNARCYEADSTLCKMLKTHAWIPVGEAEFKQPKDCTVADLASELKRNEGLACLLGIQPDPEKIAKKALATHETLVTQAGFSPEVAALLVQNKDALTPEIINEIISAHTTADADRPEFPERPVQNPERRATVVRTRARKADPKTFDIRKRSVRVSAPQVSPKVWLREMYTNKEGITVCQLCCKAMPFRIPTTGEYYFKAVQVADNFSKEDHCLYLALCPLCAAKYIVLVKNDNDRLSDFIWAVEQAAAGDLVVPIQMDGVTSHIRFVEAHLRDIRAVLAECLQ